MKTLWKQKLAYWHRKHGAWGMVRLAFQKVWRRLFQNDEVIFYVDLAALGAAPPPLPEGIAIKHYSRIDAIPAEDLKRLADYKGGAGLFRAYLEKFFRRGATFWIVKVQGQAAGFRWTYVGRHDEFFVFPMNDQDAILMSSEVMPEYRGRGINPIMIDQVLHALKKQGVTRVYNAACRWNRASVRSIAKSSFTAMGRARRFNILGRHVTVWRGEAPIPQVAAQTTATAQASLGTQGGA